MSDNQEPNIDGRFAPGLPADASDQDKKLFAEYRLRTYKERTHWRGDTLSEYFADDFRHFTLADFRMIDADP